MYQRRFAVALLLLAVFVAAAPALMRPSPPGSEMTAAAAKYLGSLSEEQRAVSQLTFDTPQRVQWHFIPKDERKGLQIKHMNPEQREAAHALLRSCLSKLGYTKATQIMKLEALLKELEKGRSGGPLRDDERYYFTVFGTPSVEEKWGLSIEGHHLSLNFVVDQGAVTSSTPTFFAANPATVKEQVLEGFPRGLQVLKDEEELAFELVGALTDEQKKLAVIADKAPREIRAAGEPQPPQDKAEGISAEQLQPAQRKLLQQLVLAYARNLPEPIARERMQAIGAAGVKHVHFAWAGAQEPGVGHYYRIQGPTFLIEFVNTQPDAAGNPANHIHCVWRDMKGDFALTLSE